MSLANTIYFELTLCQNIINYPLNIQHAHGRERNSRLNVVDLW